MRILIASWNAAPAIVPVAGTGVGGGETRSWNIAWGLARSPENDVSFCVRTRPGSLPDRVGPVQILPLSEPLLAIKQSVLRQVSRSPRFPWLTVRNVSGSLFWQLPVLVMASLLTSAMRERSRKIRKLIRQTSPDVIIAFGVNQESAATVLAGRSLGVPVLIWLRSNNELNPRFFSESNYRDPYGVSSQDAAICLSQATRILCQTPHQLEQLRLVATTPGRVIRNPVDLDRFAGSVIPFEDRQQVLWVGRYDRHHKRPLLGLEVARRCPEIPFVMVINSSDEGVRQEVLQKKPSNVTLVDAIPSDRMPDSLRASRLFLSTGSPEFEGFPNLFLEAAATGTPIVSLEDFDGFLTRSGGGFAADGDPDRLARLTQQLWGDTATWNRCSHSGRAFVQQHHTLEEMLSQLHAVLTEIAP